MNAVNMPMLSSIPGAILLRRALLADGTLSGAAGIALLLAAGPLGDQFGLPEALLRVAGLSMLPWAVALSSLARQARPSHAGVLTVVAVNVLWVLGSALLLLAGWVDPTALGYAFVIVQALAVVAFAEVQFLGLRRASPMLA